MKKYLDRYIDKQLEEALESMGAVLLIGPKWCGKTTTAMQQAKDVIKLQDPRYADSYMEVASIDILALLDGENPLLIDEWQMIPQLWDAVRFEVDERDDVGLYILTGSTVVNEDEIMHSGAGRIHRLKMLPMSLYESGDSNGKISLLELFENPDLNINNIKSDLGIKDLVFAACRGGWPDTLNKKSPKQQLFIAKSYVDVICQTDISTIDNVKRNPDKVKTLLMSYARNLSTLTKNKVIRGDVISQHGQMSQPTYDSYIVALKRLFVIEDTPAWSPNIRSRKRIRQTPKRSFIDPSIAVAVLDLNPDELWLDTKTFGFIFECLCTRDLKVYSSIRGGKVYHYHDDTGLEVDCIVKLNNGDYALIEVKLGSDEEDKAAKNLLKLDSLIKKAIESGDVNIPEPKFLAILTGGQMAKTRKDGVKVIPIGTLR